MSSDPFVVLDHARVDEQRQVMEQIAVEGVCPFCYEHLDRFHGKPILWRGVDWVVTESRWPYRGSRVHLLIIARQHAEKLDDLPPRSGSDLWQALQWIEREYELTSGAVGLRFGNPMQNGGSVRHLHAHVIVADQTQTDQHRVRFKMG